MQHSEDREDVGDGDLKRSLTRFIFRYRGFRAGPTRRDRSAPTFAHPNANDPLRQRKKSKKLFSVIA